MNHVDHKSLANIEKVFNSQNVVTFRTTNDLADLRCYLNYLIRDHEVLDGVILRTRLVSDRLQPDLWFETDNDGRLALLYVTLSLTYCERLAKQLRDVTKSKFEFSNMQKHRVRSSNRVHGFMSANAKFNRQYDRLEKFLASSRFRTVVPEANHLSPDEFLFVFSDGLRKL